jgi:L-lactate utilization protein LutC
MKWAELASEDTVKRTRESLEARGIRVGFLQKREEALKRIIDMIPQGAEVMTGSSTTLQEIGFVDLLTSGKHKWNNLKGAIVKEKDSLKQMELRKRSITAEYFLGSVHAVTQSGEVIVVSNTGSQLPSYAYSSNNVVWVVGAQKIVLDMEDGMKRVREYCLPLEDNRMKRAGFRGSAIGKILIFERETLPKRTVTLIFVNEKLGF